MTRTVDVTTAICSPGVLTLVEGRGSWSVDFGIFFLEELERDLNRDKNGFEEKRKLDSSVMGEAVMLAKGSVHVAHAGREPVDAVL